MRNENIGKICKRNEIAEESFYNFQTKEAKNILEDKVLKCININENDKVVIFAGHYYIPNPETPSIVSKNSQKTWETACQYVSELKNQGIKAYLSLMLNDVELPLQDNIKARKIINQNFEFPEEFKDIMSIYGLTETDLITQYKTKTKVVFKKAKNYKNGKLSKMRFVNAFSRKGPNTFRRTFPDTYDEVKKEFTACPKAIAQYILELDRNDFDTVLFIIPGCTQDSLKKGHSILQIAINNETPTKGRTPEIKAYALYQTGCCYDP